MEIYLRNRGPSEGHVTLHIARFRNNFQTRLWNCCSWSLGQSCGNVQIFWRGWQELPHAFCERKSSGKTRINMGIPWWFSGQDLVVSLLRAWVPSVIGELRVHKPCGTVLKKKTRINELKLQESKCLVELFASRTLHKFLCMWLLNEFIGKSMRFLEAKTILKCRCHIPASHQPHWLTLFAVWSFL